MILGKPRQFARKLPFRRQMRFDARDVALGNSLVESLVVGEVKPKPL
jgi:hypothetical protein